MFSRLKELFFREQNLHPENVEKLRTDFQERYHHFKLLLNANNQVLKLITQMDAALRGTSPFRMTFVRDKCAKVSTNVFQMIKHLNLLAPQKYETLFSRFKDIESRIKPFISRSPNNTQGPFVLSLDDISDRHWEEVGSKMAKLGEVRSTLHRNTPAGFVITAHAYREFMGHNDFQSEIYRRIQTLESNDLSDRHELSAKIQNLILTGEIPDAIKEAIINQVSHMSEHRTSELRLALRSSALGEDHLRNSFAGQYKSLLNIDSENILGSYKTIIASKYSVRAMSYRMNRGIRDEDVAMCVGCIEMIDGKIGGVIYTRNPIKLDDDSVIINSAFGLPKIVVDGGANLDVFKTSREEPPAILKRKIVAKNQQYIPNPAEGIASVEVAEELSTKSSLTDEQVIELTKIGLEIENHFGVAQDIEWAIDAEGNVVILQSRPLLRINVTSEDSPAPLNPDNKIILKGGITASPGVSCGKTYLVKQKHDVYDFPDGAVLVTKQALPHWAVLLDRAAAVISEQGTMTGHLANVAREFETPAIFGIEDAAKVLQSGQLVTVDADSRKVYAGEVKELIARNPKPHNPMEGSVVYNALKSAFQHISPLNLVDPDSPTFKPENCQTFHDITRYCHERSVAEMFRFGRDHKFPERSSKQLYTDVAMKWWVLNLDDGFREEVQDKYVKISNIVSTPMLALWSGITWKPWVGPPPIDGKGFMSVIFEATANPALTISTRSSYADKNYFMVSKNFCSLASRLGFHFTTVEALVSERSAENYVSFQFKGGATDMDRRVKRLHFAREILEKYNFLVDVKGDLLIARLFSQDQDTMIESLRVLGYLIIHTRQLDMVMSNPNAVNHYMKTISDDITEMLATENV